MRRIVADLHVTPETIAPTTAFFAEVIGMDVGMDMGWLVNLGSPDNATAQVQLLTHDAAAPVVPDLTVEVSDLDAVLERARSAGHEIVHGPIVESWGVRRFFVRDPSGHIINVMTHAK